jgi:hypothetical protein
MESIQSTNDLRIGVINLGPVEPKWQYNGQEFHYKIKNAEGRKTVTVVPWVVAEQHFALALKKNQDGSYSVVRKDWKEPQDRDSLLESRLAGLCHKQLHKPDKDLPGHYIDNPIIKDWYLNKLRFQVRVTKYEMSEEEFNTV